VTVDPRAGGIGVRFWGTRGSIPTPGPSTATYGGNTSCVEVRAGDLLLIFDAGTGLRLLGLDLLGRADGRPIEASMFISHTHWDHIQGLPFFVPAYARGNRLAIYGPPGVDQTLERVIHGQMDPHYFPVDMTAMAAALTFHECVETTIALEDVVVRTHYLHHTAITLGYRVEHAGRAIVYATDHEMYRRMYLARGDSPAMLASAERHDADFAAFLAGADLYIADTQYTLAEYGPKRGWGHSTVEDIAALAASAGVKQLALFHYDPLRNDADVAGLVAAAEGVIADRRATTRCLAAREGASLTI
jgi:phosphoribosyl 1,2-cyclic phosphodiesterase